MPSYWPDNKPHKRAYRRPLSKMFYWFAGDWPSDRRVVDHRGVFRGSGERGGDLRLSLRAGVDAVAAFLPGAISDASFGGPKAKSALTTTKPCRTNRPPFTSAPFMPHHAHHRVIHK